MSAPQNSTGGDASEHVISGVARDSSEAVAAFEKAVEEFGCTDLLFVIKPGRGNQGVAAQPETGTVAVDAANPSNISAENSSAENDSSTKK
ncbi:hypothetical protein FPCIR_12932 [Fusarium pseudocircinatum]|uniref:Uncharacterized protein n=1 Tax=Fusarium pseudocircinatum TaxID=56676 RepID=A0A8H5KP38_9HYPO|nr:hypothetical protein FPCIR_12932 [Fusarium pseudocircinatum]